MADHLNCRWLPRWQPPLSTSLMCLRSSWPRIEGPVCSRKECGSPKRSSLFYNQMLLRPRALPMCGEPAGPWGGGSPGFLPPPTPSEPMGCSRMNPPPPTDKPPQTELWLLTLPTSLASKLAPDCSRQKQLRRCRGCGATAGSQEALALIPACSFHLDRIAQASQLCKDLIFCLSNGDTRMTQAVPRAWQRECHSCHLRPQEGLSLAL